MTGIISSAQLGVYGNGGVGSGSPMVGRLGQSDAYYVNTTTGNLILQAQDEVLVSLGLDLALVRTYNSQGLVDGDNNDGWRLGVYRRLHSLTGSVDTAGSTITKVYGDGAEVVFTYDAARGLYVATVGEGAHDTLSFSSASSEWTYSEGDSLATEVYDESGRLLRLVDADGNTTRFTYTGSLISSIGDAAGQATYLTYSGTNLTQIQVLSNGFIQTLTRYTYDTQNRLTEVTVDLSPEDNAIGDGRTYVTTYTYDGASTRIASITQGDSSTVSFTYEEINGEHRVKTVTDGEGKVTTFTYVDATHTEVTDPLGFVTTYVTDANGRLTQVLSPAVDGTRLTTSYSYDPEGNLTGVTDARGNVTAMEYDARGNLTLTRDALGNTVTRTYSANNRLLTEMVYVVPDPDGAGAGQPSVPVTTRYAYDSEHHLRFVISAEGRVIEHRYAANGNRTSSITYAGGAYDVASLTPTDTLSEAQLQAWVNTQDLTQTQRRDYAYDFRGQLSTTTTYASVSVTGESIADGTHALTRFLYDQRGRLIQRIEPRGEATGDPNDYLTSYAYDGLGRLLTANQWVSATETRTTTTTYDDAGNRLLTNLQNGLTTTTVYDRRGLLLSVSQAAWSQALGTTRYKYDAAGRLRMVVDPIGNKTHRLYDEAGRVVAVIDATGSLTETVYDNAGNAIKQIRYANRPTSLQLASLIEASGDPAVVTLASLRPAADSTNDRVTRTIYDNANRLVMTVVSHDTDANQAYVTQTFYDGAGRMTDVIAYANAVSLAGLTDTATPADITARLTTASEDRHTRRFYDGEGRLIGTLDAEGYVTESIYNAAGHLTHTVAYATATDVSLRATGTLAQLKTSAGTSSNDQHSHRFYNAKGELIASVDAEGYLTEYAHDAAGNQTQSLRYYTRANAYSGTQTVDQLRPSAHVNDQVTVTAYNGANQVTEVITNPSGTVTRYTYNSVGNLTRTDKAWNTAEVRTTRAHYDLQGRLVHELSAEGVAALEAALAANPAADTAAIWLQWSLTHCYDQAGRRLYTLDRNGFTTWFYYDAAGRLTHTINHWGEVTETRYNAFGDVEETIRYTARIWTSGVTGGTMTQEIRDRLSENANAASDARTQTNHSLRGAVKEVIAWETASLSHSTRYSYDAFDLTVIDRPGSASARSLTSYYYDRVGRLLQSAEDIPAGGDASLNRLTGYYYDAFGRLTRKTTASGTPDAQTTRFTYDRLGRELTITDPAGARATTYDARGRALTQRDARGNTTVFTYDDATRRLTMTTAEGIATTTLHDRHGQTVSITDGNGVTTTYGYDKNGNLKTVIGDDTPAGLRLATTNTYDRANRRIESTDANGTRTVYTYDVEDRLLTKTLDPLGLNLKTVYTYDGQGRTLTITDGADTAEASVTRYTYDRKGQTLSVLLDPAGLNLGTTYIYDALGKTVTVTEGQGTSEASTTAYRYDNLGRRIESIKDPGGLAIRCLYTYDLNDNLTSKTEAPGTPDEVTTRFVYDTDNRLSYTVDALGGVTQNAYDQHGNVTATTRYANLISLTGLSSAVTEADITARLSELPIRDQTTRFAYDRDNRLRFTVDSRRGLIEHQHDGAGHIARTTRYANPLSSDIAVDVAVIEAAIPSLRNAADQETRTTFDAAGRLTEVIHAFGTSIQYIDTYAYDAAGNQLRHTNGRGHSEYTAYDGANREIRHIDVAGYVVDSTYDKVNNLRTKTVYMNAVAQPATPDERFAYNAPNPAPNTDPVSGDRITSYTYDKAGRIETETAPAIGTALGVVTRYQYDARGNVTDKIEAQGLIEERTTHSVHDKLDRLIEQTTAYGAPEAATSRFTYDAHGNQRTIIDPRGIELAEKDTLWAQGERQRLGYSQTAASLTQPQRETLKTLYTTTQAFDQLNRKTAAINSLGGRTDTLYDSFGNIIKVTDPNGNAGYFYYDQLNRATLQVDAEGYATETIYDLFGNTKETIKYANKVQGSYNGTTKPLVVTTAPGTTPPPYVLIDAQKDQHIQADYDQLNRTTKITDAENYVETFQYDAEDNVTAHVDKNNNTFTYDYDAKGNKIAEYLPTTSANAQGQQVQVVNRCVYDAVGNKTKYTEASGLPEERVTQYVYDKNNRVVETIEPNVLVGVEVASVGGNLTMGSGGTANYAISQTTPDISHFYSNVQVSWPPIIGYGDGDIKVVWNTGISSLGVRTGFVSAQATSITITGHNGEVTNNILGPGDFYEVSIYKQTSNGDVLITHTTGEYAFPNLLLGYRLLGTFSASSETPNLLHFTGQPAAGSTLRLAYWPSSDSDNITQLDLASYAPGTFSGMTSTVLSGGYGYEATVFDSQGAVLNRFSGTFSVTGSTVITTVQGIPLTTGQLQTPHTYKSYDIRGNLIKETDAKGDSTYYYYDANSRKIASVDAERYLHRYFYDAAGNLIAERTYDQAIPVTVSLAILPDPIAIVGMDASKYRETMHRYDANNRLGESRTQAVFIYDHVNGLRTQVLTITQAYDRNGNVTLSTDANGNRTYSYYGKVGHKILQVDALGYVIAWDYDANSNLTSETQYANPLNAATLAALSTSSDPLALKQAVAGNSDDRITEYGYDRMNRMTVQTVVGLSYATISTTGAVSEQTANVTTQYLYDGEGNRTALIQADGSRSDYTYDALKRLIREQGAAFSDFEGTVVRATTETTYDGIGNVRTQTRKGKTAAADQITRYEYDPHGNRIQEIDALGNPVYYFYDLNGNVTIQRTRRINPDGTQPSVDTRYTYDKLSRQVTTEDAKNFVYHATYNAHGEIIAKGLNGLAQEYFEYDLAGRLVKTNKDDGVDRAYFYDANGNETVKIQSAEQDTDLKPLSLGQIASLGSTLVQSTESEYDARDQLIKTYQAPIEFTASTFGSEHVWLDVLSDPFRGGTITPAKGGTANYAISQTTPDISHFYSNVQVSWPPIIGYGDGDIKVVWNTGISSLGVRTGFVSAQATSITITGHNGEVTNNILGPGDFYEVSIYKQTSNGDVLITRTTGEYAFPNLLLGYRLLGTFSASSETPNLLHFTGQRAEAESLQLWLWPINGTKPATPISVPRVVNSSGNAVPGSFAFDWSSYANGNYNYEFKTLDGAGVELDYVSGTLTLATNPAVNSKYIDTIQLVLTDDPSVTQNTIIRSQIHNAFGEVVTETDGRSYTTNFTYNDLGKLVEKKDPETNATAENGAIVRVHPTTNYYYDALGRTVATRDANTNTSTQRYDTAGHLVAEYNTDGDDKTYGYDIFGNRRFAKDELDQRTDFSFDRNNQLIRIDRPTHVSVLTDAGNPSAPRFDIYAYDEAGRRIRHTNAFGQSELTYYDDIGRVKKAVSFGGISTDYRYIYDSVFGGSTAITTTGDGRTLEDTKNYFGRLLSHKDLAGHTFSYQYNEAGWLIHQTGNTDTDPELDQDISFTYYQNGYLKEAIDAGVNARTKYQYDANGNRIFEGYYQGTGSVYYQWSHATYDELNRVTEINDPKYNVSYEYDANGNRRHVYARYHNGLNNDIQRQDYWYTYDAMNRFLITKGELSGTTYDTEGEPIWNRGSGAIAAGAEGYAVTYDAAGQRATAAYEASDGTTWRELYHYAVDGLLEYVETKTSESAPYRTSARRFYDAAGNVKQYLELNSSGSVTRNYQYTYTGDTKVLTENNGQFTSTYAYDNAGNLTQIVSPQAGGTTLTTSYTYEYWDSAKQKEIKLQASNQQAPGWAPGFSRFTYDVNGHLTQVSDVAGNRHLSYKVDADGRILQRNELIGTTSSRTQYYYYLNGIGVGDAGGFGSSRQDYASLLAARGQNQGRNGQPVSSADFDYNFQPINDRYPATTPGSYTVRQGDTLQSVALAVWGDASLWYLIADANGLDTSTTLIANQTLVIPNVVENIHNSAGTHKVYNPGELIGDTTPTLPDAPPPPMPSMPSGKKGKCGGFGKILVIIVTIVVAYYTGISLEGAGWSQGFAAAGGAAAGSVAGQLTGMALGIQDKFSWKAVAIATLTAGATKGLQVDKIGNVVIREATKNVLSQGVSMLMGQQERFSWASFAVSAITAPIDEAINNKFGSTNVGRELTSRNFAKSLAGEFLKSVTHSAATFLVNGGGKLDWETVAVNSLGNSIGSSIADDARWNKTLGKLNPAQRQVFDRMRTQQGYTPEFALNFVSTRFAPDTVSIPAQTFGVAPQQYVKGEPVAPSRSNVSEAYPEFKAPPSAWDSTKANFTEWRNGNVGFSEAARMSFDMVDFWHRNELRAAGQVVAGGLEVGAGLLLAETGVGVPLGVLFAAHGGDRFGTGFSALMRGEPQETLTYQGLSYVTPNHAHAIDDGITFLSGVAMLGGVGVDAMQATRINRIMRNDLEQTDHVYRAVGQKSLDSYRANGYIAGLDNTPIYFSMEAGENVLAHMVKTQMRDEPMYLLKVPTSEVTGSSVPRPLAYDRVQNPRNLGWEYHIDSYPEFGAGGFRQFTGTTKTFSDDWIIPGWGAAK